VRGPFFGTVSISMLRFAFFRVPLLSLAGFALVASSAPRVRAQQAVPDYELPEIAYSKATPDDAVARLQRRIDAGELVFQGTGRELLLAVLKALHVPVESQTLVFSKTSLQKERISPETPRALYFSETVYVGWVPGGLIEVAAIDPQLGPIFYHFKANDAPEVPKKFERDASCMLCHGYFFIRDVPSLLALTGVPDKTGEFLARSDFDLVDDATRFEKRWGGWYVTGYTGTENHRGNAFGVSDGKTSRVVPTSARPAQLSEFFDTSRYPAATSDAANLLILEHQIALYTTLIRAHQNARLAPRLSRPSLETEVVDRLLFRRAARLPEGIVKNGAFMRAFTADARRSAAGDSLKDLMLDGQLFRNRCSYLIYSEAFAALPAGLKTGIYRALYDALQNDDPASRYAYLEKAERRRIYDILMETHPEARQQFEALAATVKGS
jgi:hypothetical protein